MKNPSKSRPSRTVVIGDLWLSLALQAIAAAKGATAPVALVLHDTGMLEALAFGHPDYAASITQPGFACLLTSDSHPYRIAARIRAAAEQAKVAA